MRALSRVAPAATRDCVYETSQLAKAVGHTSPLTTGGETETHYVLVIHGTFNAPSQGETKWYQPSDVTKTFCSRLQERLNSFGPAMQDAVWRSFTVDTAFSWSGANDHRERLGAAYKLKKTFADIVERNPNARIHVVAHSHGGNVLLHAVETSLDPAPESRREIQMRDIWRWYLRDSPRLLRWFKLDASAQPASGTRAYSSPADHLGHLVFLGTPFLRKQWTPSGAWPIRLILRVIGNVPGALVGSSLTFYLIALGFAGAAALLSDFTFVGMNPLKWPSVMRWVVGFWALMYALVILFDEGRYNTNLYFAEHRYKRGLPRKRLPVLVVSAKLLDEALLALSTEAVVAAELFPRVDELLHPERSWPLHQLFAFVRSRRREQTGGEQADHPWVDDSQTGSIGRRSLTSSHLCCRFL